MAARNGYSAGFPTAEKCVEPAPLLNGPLLIGVRNREMRHDSGPTNFRRLGQANSQLTRFLERRTETCHTGINREVDDRNTPRRFARSKHSFQPIGAVYCDFNVRSYQVIGCFK